jgi:hypothetical protein
MIVGFLENVCREEARGWAFDSESPEKRLEVFLYDGQRILGRTRADIYRHDLRTPELGDGEHAFVFSFKDPVELDIIDSIFAQVEGVGASPVRLERLPPNSNDSSFENYDDQIYWDNKNIDEDAKPLFILESVSNRFFNVPAFVAAG